MPAPQEKPAHAVPAALPPGRPASTQGNAAPSRPPFFPPHGFPARERRALPCTARPPRKGAPRLHDRSRAAFPCAAPLLRKGAPRLSLAAFPRSTRLPRKETLGLHDRPFFPPHGFLAMERCGGTSFPAPRGFIARERCGVIPALASLGFPRKGALRLSGLSLAARPRRNRPRGALAPRGLLRLPLAWLVLSEGAVALGLCPALAVLLPSLGEELIQ